MRARKRFLSCCRGLFVSKPNSLGMSGVWILRVLVGIVNVVIADGAAADELLLSKNLSRDRVINAVYQLDQPYTGRAILFVEWVDGDHRLIERQKLALRFYKSKT